MSNQIDAISKYSGSKARFAHKVVESFLSHVGERKIIDICAGSGAITLELRRRGIPAQRLSMVEAAHYGGVFKLMSQGRFSRKSMMLELEQLPENPADVQEYLEQLSSKPCDESQVLYRFLLLQSVALRALQIQYIDGAWSNAVFDVNRHIKGESYDDSGYEYVAPNPERIMSKIDKFAKELYGVTVYHADAMTVDYSGYENALVYVDPPYTGTAGYHFDISLDGLLERLPESCLVFVSEAIPLSDDAQLVYQRHGRDEYVSRLR